jgi:lambda family phage portal protein
LIGTGIKPLSQAPDPALRTQIQALWLRWTDESDADGLLDFYGQQAQATRCWLEAGEVFARDRFRLPADGLSVPYQVQVLEPELCPHTHTAFTSGGNRIRAGMEFNAIGKRVAYYFHTSRPDLDGDFDPSQLRRVPAESVHHVYDPLRAGQLRGIPHLTQALIKLHELDKFDDATLLRQQLANMFVAFLKRNAGVSDSETLNPLTGGPVTSTDEPPMLTLEPGIFQQLEPGEDVTFSEPPDMQAGYADFMRLHLRAVAVATGVPYEVLTGDMTGMNDRTVRVVLNEFKRRMQMLQHQILVFQFCVPIWSAWIRRAFLSGALPMPADYAVNPQPYEAVKWMPSRWAYLHPVQDVEADREAIRAGFTTRSAVVSEYGEDAEQIDAEQGADNDRADALGLKYSSDSRVPVSGAAAPAPAPADEGALAGATS